MTKNEVWDRQDFKGKIGNLLIKYNLLPMTGDIIGEISDLVEDLLAQSSRQEREELIKHFESCKDFSMTIPEIVADIKAIAFKESEESDENN